MKQAIKSTIQSCLNKLQPKSAELPLLQDEKTVWITKDHLGTVQTLQHDGREIKYRVPQEIGESVTLRFKGYSKTVSGNLLVHLKIDRGEDVHANIWLSRRQAAHGGAYDLHHGGGVTSLSIPLNTVDGATVRLDGQGKQSSFQLHRLFARRATGDVVVRCSVYPDVVVPVYRHFDTLTDEALALEGWIYRRTEFILNSLPVSPFSVAPLTAEQVTGAFNTSGYRGIAKLLIQRLKALHVPIDVDPSKTLSQPGQIHTMSRNNKIVSATIYIKADFLNDPFAVTAILAHELCHLIEVRYLSQRDLSKQLTGKPLMEMERTVDLLVFLYQFGEFQLRVARNRLLTLGYFNQELFERMYVIASRKKDG